MTETLRDYLDFAIDTAWQAGQLTLGYFQTGIRPDFKSDDSPVTVADRETEKLVRSRIEQRFPGHIVIGEEFGGKELLSESNAPTHRWIVDPIDGTRSFVRGVPLYAVLIALEIEGTIEVGVAHFPALGEMIAAATGEGCWWNGRRAHVSDVEHVDKALLAHSDAGNFKNFGRLEEWERLQNATEYRAGWCDAYGYLLVATGRADIMIDPIMNEWDCGPFIPILQEAGGYFGDWQGNPTIYGNEAMATTQNLLPQVLKIIKG